MLSSQGLLKQFSQVSQILTLQESVYCLDEDIPKAITQTHKIKKITKAKRYMCSPNFSMLIPVSSMWCYILIFGYKKSPSNIFFVYYED